MYSLDIIRIKEMRNLLLGKKKFSNSKRSGTIPSKMKKPLKISLKVQELTPSLSLYLVFVLDLAKRVGSPEWLEVIEEDNVLITLIMLHMSQAPPNFLHIRV